jgi:hypothetical protein
LTLPARRLRNSVIDSDDDGICLKIPGPAPASMSPSATVRQQPLQRHQNGTESTGGFKHVQISDIVVKPCAPKAKFVYGRARDHRHHGGVRRRRICEDITIRDITIEGTLSPIFVRLGKRKPAPHARRRSHGRQHHEQYRHQQRHRDAAETGAAPFSACRAIRSRTCSCATSRSPLQRGTEEDSKREIKEGLTSYPQRRVGNCRLWAVHPECERDQPEEHQHEDRPRGCRPPVWLENIEGAVLSDVKANGARVATEQIIRKTYHIS